MSVTTVKPLRAKNGFQFKRLINTANDRWHNARVKLLGLSHTSFYLQAVCSNNRFQGKDIALAPILDVNFSKYYELLLPHGALLLLHLQLFQLTLSDQSFKPMRQDRMVVWGEVEGCCTCQILMKYNGFVVFFFLFRHVNTKFFMPQ